MITLYIYWLMCGMNRVPLLVKGVQQLVECGWVHWMSSSECVGGLFAEFKLHPWLQVLVRCTSLDKCCDCHYVKRVFKKWLITSLAQWTVKEEVKLSFPGHLCVVWSDYTGWKQQPWDPCNQLLVIWRFSDVTSPIHYKFIPFNLKYFSFCFPIVFI